MRKMIQVGLGAMGTVWAGVVAGSDRWQAAAYVDPDRKRLLAAATRFGMPKSRCFTDLTRALNEVEADAVLDAVPQKFRKQVVTTAFKQGLDVLSEKPLADTLANAKQIVARAEKLGRTFMVAQNYRYQPLSWNVKRFVEAGRIGDLGYVGVSFHKGPKFGGFREKMKYPLVMDMAIHHIDLMRFLLDADVKSVQATSINAPWNWNKGDATAMVQLEMDNGVAVNYHSSWVATGWETDWYGDWRFDGSKGALLWANNTINFSDKPNSKRKVRLSKAPEKSGQAYLLDAFADALDNHAEPETSGRQNLNSLASTFAVVRSFREKRRVLVEELLT